MREACLSFHHDKETILTPEAGIAWHRTFIAKQCTGFCKAQLFFQAIVLLSSVGPVTGFAQWEIEPRPYLINHFEISGKVAAYTEDYSATPYLSQSERMSERLNWLLGDSELIRSLDLNSNRISTERSKSGTPLSGINQGSYEIKQSARTDRINAEINVSVTLEVNGSGITIKGLQSAILGPVQDDFSHSEASVGMSFGVKVGKKGVVHITGCDVFDKSLFRNQPGYEDDGENCSFQVQEQYAGQFGAKPSPLLDEFFKNMPQEVRDSLAREISGYPLTFIAEFDAEANGQSDENRMGIEWSRPFKITFGSDCEKDTPTVKVSSGRRQEQFEQYYKECSRNIVNAVNGSFPGLVKIGGPNRKCILPGPNMTKQEWFVATAGKCKSKYYSGYSETNKYAKFNSNPSSHADGFGLDLFVSNEGTAKVPKGCVLEAGNRIADWARDNASAYGIKNVIWNKRIASGSSQWKEVDFKKAAKLPHYDHVHVQCKN